MIAIDTNILVRIVTNDSPEQVKQAVKLLREHSIFISKTVILELEWVLRFSYKLNRDVIATTLQKILTTHNFIIEQPLIIEHALQWYQQGMDFADALHLASSFDAEKFASFDKKLLKKAIALKTGIEIFEI
jgi:predicted nucleic-acid-binding protein